MFTANRIVVTTAADLRKRILKSRNEYYHSYHHKSYSTKYPYIYDWVAPDCKKGKLYQLIIAHGMGNHKLSRDAVSNFDTTRITRMDKWFLYGDRVGLDISAWDVGNVTSMKKTFIKCSFAPGLEDCINNWQPTSLKRMTGTFMWSKMFDSGALDISSWYTPNLISLFCTFNRSSFDIVQLRNWDLSNLDTNSYSFAKIRNLVDISEVMDILLQLPYRYSTLSKTPLVGIKKALSMTDDDYVLSLLPYVYLLPKEYHELLKYYRSKPEYAHIYKILISGRIELINHHF